MSSIDNLVEYIWDILDHSVSPTAIASFCYRVWSHDIKSTNINPAHWIVKDADNAWRPDPYGVILRMRISSILPIVLREALAIVNKSLDKLLPDSPKKPRLLTWRRHIGKYISEIAKIPFKRDVMEECSYLFLRADDKSVPDILQDNDDVFNASGTSLPDDRPLS